MKEKLAALWNALNEKQNNSPLKGSIPRKLREFNQFINDEFWAKTPLSDENAKEAQKEIAEWWNSNIATTEAEQIEVEDVGVPTPSKTEFESQVPAEVSGKKTGKYYENIFSYGMSEASFNKLLSLFGVNPNEEAVYNYIAGLDLGDPFRAEALDYLELMTGETLLRPAFTEDGVPVLDANETQVLMPFTGHFQGIKVEDFIDSNATPDEINRWQTYLEQNNIVPDNYFAESRGEMSEKLRASVKYVMNWLDENRYVVKGTDIYETIMQQTPVYFTSSSAAYDEADYHRNLLQYALEEMAVAQDALDDVEEAKIAKQLAEEYIPPTKANLEDMVENYFSTKLGRKPTEEELDQWSTTFADSYSVAFAQARSKAKQLADYNFMVAQPEYLEMTSQQEQLQKDYPGAGFIDLSAFSTASPEEIMNEQLESEYGKQIDAVESGRRIRKLQSDLLSYMAGR